MLTIPGMFFELVLPFWLCIKGFQPEAYGGRAEVVMTPTVRPAPAALSPKERHAELTEASCENRRRPLPARDRHEVREACRACQNSNNCRSITTKTNKALHRIEIMIKVPAQACVEFSPA